jgi:hypothetical protein
LNDYIRRKDSETNKLKGLIGVKEEYIGQLEQELKQSKDQIISVEQLLQAERENIRQKELKAEKKTG